jgi:hypothetical protein
MIASAATETKYPGGTTMAPPKWIKLSSDISAVSAAVPICPIGRKKVPAAEGVPIEYGVQREAWPPSHRLALEVIAVVEVGAVVAPPVNPIVTAAAEAVVNPKDTDIR